MLVKQILHARTFMFACLILPLLMAPTVGQEPVHQVFDALNDQLQQPIAEGSHAFLERLSSTTGAELAGLRSHLRELLDQLEAHRRNKSPAWRQLISLGGSRADPKKVEKLITELRKRADKALKKKRDYALSDLLGNAAMRADLPEHRARAILLSAIGVNPDSAAVFTGFPERVSVMVSVHSCSLGGGRRRQAEPALRRIRSARWRGWSWRTAGSQGCH